jgi:hypothetical protein
MENKELSLAFSMQSNKGIYALLLGSGISYSSGILTGWGILTELCRRVMVLEGDSHENPIEWYENKYEKKPLYDELIEGLCKTSSERNGLLREFFEPTEEDLSNGLKVPSPGHKSIAKLVRSGHIKVIVTTNFDRLIEKALEDENISFQTIYHETDIEGMKPLAHVECTVFKVHGDYKDTRFKNVTNELETYPESINNLLKAIFSDYGIIVSGWSAEWDSALRSAIKGASGRRYSWYWTSLNERISAEAKEIINHRDGIHIINNGGSDRFFTDLLNNVDAIRRLKLIDQDVISVKINKVKKFIIQEKDTDLHDIVLKETLILHDFIEGIDTQKSLDKVQYIELIDLIVEKSITLSSIMSVLSYFCKNSFHEKILINTLERFTTTIKREGITLTLKLLSIPLLLIKYSIGISLTAKENFALLNKVLLEPFVRDIFYSERGINFLYYSTPYRKLEEAISKIMPSGVYYGHSCVFLSSKLEKVFVSNIAINKEEYNIYFDLFEFLLSIKHRHEGVDYFHSGKFVNNYGNPNIEQFLKNGKNKGDQWDVLSLFNNNKTSFKESLIKFTEEISKDNWHNAEKLSTSYMGE